MNNDTEEITTQENIQVQDDSSEKKKEHSEDIALVSEGINLVPVMSKVEVEKEDRKNKVNMSVLAGAFIFILITFSIVFFNLFTKNRLANETKKLEELSTKITTNYTELMTENNQLLERIDLYQEIKSSQYSTNRVVDYLNGLADSAGKSKISNFEFRGENNIEFRGSSGSLEDVSKLWYILCNVSNLSDVILSAMGKGDDSVSFTFTGKINIDNFL